MEIVMKTVKEIVKNAINAIEKINEKEIKKMIKEIRNSDRIFVVGTGRSELVGKAFAMRLMHLGFNVHVVGEVTTPAIRDKDCLIAISGSGETKTVTIAAETSKKIGACVIGITSTQNSTLWRIADIKVVIPTKSKKAWKDYTSESLKGEYGDLMPLGTLFEDTAQLFLDGVIAELMTILGKKEEDLRKRHETFY